MSSKGGSARRRREEANVAKFAERSMSEVSIEYVRKKARHPLVIETGGELSQQLSNTTTELAVAIRSNLALQRDA